MKRIIFLLTLLPFLLSAAKKNASYQLLHHYDIQAHIMNAGIGMPLHFINGRLQPGVQLGMMSHLKKKKGFLHQYGVGYFAHRSLQRICYVRAGMQYAFPVYKKLYLHPQANFSGMIVRQTNREFKFVNGVYKEVGSTRLQLMPSLGMDISYPVLHHGSWSYSLYAGYEFGIQYPFSTLSSTLPIQQIKLGIQLHHK